ncbi:MAG: regulator [Leptospira sp.]|nr:MAG: regulator [Leptospira sp.]
METKIKNIFKNTSLRLQIGLLYTILAFVNIVFFSVMIFENQSDLLIRSFKFQSENLVNLIQNDLNVTSFTIKNQEEFDIFRKKLKLYEIQNFKIYDSTGSILAEYPQTKANLENLDRSKVLEKIKEVGILESGSIFKSRYKLELNEANFSVLALIPFTVSSKKEFYLETQITLSSIQERLNQIYVFMAIATTWGILFHILFAVYVYKIIFQRLGILKRTSEQMATGNLSARANWKMDRKDELDSLGETFNSMAIKIEETVKTVTRLNTEINLELTIGKEVQELFLPKTKLVKDFNLAKLYRPMREVSGDIYQFFKIQKANEESLAVFIADASGHGVSAALVTVVLAMLLESILKETDEPHLVIQKLSDLVGNRMQSSFFATAVFCKIHTNSTIEICNGGHNAPLLLQKFNSKIIEIESSGPPLGMIEQHEYKTERFKAESGDKIFLYTDGLVEALNENKELFGLQRVKSKLVKDNLLNQEIVDELSQELDNFTFEYKDDVTILLLEIP